MSVSLLEVIESAGYNIEDVGDAKWLVAKQSEFNDLIDKAEQLMEEE